MKFKVGDKIYDSWWPWRKGKITKVLKTKVHVAFNDIDAWEYDKAHYQFLRLTCDKHPKYKALRKPRTCKTCWRIYNATNKRTAT